MILHASEKFDLTYCENKYFKYYRINFLNSSVGNKLKSLQIVLNTFHSLKIPYNIVILKNIIFIFPRRHENLLSTKKFAFFELLGVYSFDSLDSFDSFTHKDYLLGLMELWYTSEVYSEINEKLNFD